MAIDRNALASRFDDELEIFSGEATDAVARIYARFRGAASDGSLRLVGSLRGPSCLYAATLPANYPLVDQGSGPSLLAAAVVPEPCFWTPEMPHTYQAQLRLERDGQVLASAQRVVGIRALGARGRDLAVEGKRFVLRGVLADVVATAELAEWHDAPAALITRNIDEAVLAEAGRVGVLVVVQLEAAGAGQLRRLARWPAVGIVVLPRGATVDEAGATGNLLLGEVFGPDDLLAPAAWADLALVRVDGPLDDLARQIAACKKPVIAIRPAGRVSSVAVGRAACDCLQSVLAGHGEPAGYIV